MASVGRARPESYAEPHWMFWCGIKRGSLWSWITRKGLWHPLWKTAIKFILEQWESGGTLSPKTYCPPFSCPYCILRSFTELADPRKELLLLRVVWITLLKRSWEKTVLALEERFCVHLESECKWDSSLHSYAGWVRGVHGTGEGGGCSCEDRGDPAKVQPPCSAWRDPVGLVLPQDLTREVGRGNIPGFSCNVSSCVKSCCTAGFLFPHIQYPGPNQWFSAVLCATPETQKGAGFLLND